MKVYIHHKLIGKRLCETVDIVASLALLTQKLGVKKRDQHLGKPPKIEEGKIITKLKKRTECAV